VHFCVDSFDGYDDDWSALACLLVRGLLPLGGINKPLQGFF
jgi:hypothetical protein